MKNVYDIRRDNLKALIREYGGPLPLSIKIGYTNASFLVQMAGPNPIRDVTEKTARKIEDKLGLPAGWLDDADHKRQPKVKESDVAQIVRAVSAVLEDQRIDTTPKQLGEIVSLAYEHARLVGTVDEDFINRLVSLCHKK
jgi:hypothetical protein